MTEQIGEKTEISYRILTNYSYQKRFQDVKKLLITQLVNEGNINYRIPSSNLNCELYKATVGCTALHLTLKHEDYFNFEVLMENGADYTIKNNDGATVVHLMMESIYESAVKTKTLRKCFDLVLSTHWKLKNHVNPRNHSGLSHYHAAIIRSRTKLVKLFLNNGVAFDEAVDTSSSVFAGYTPMHFAAQFCSFDVAKLLLARGADVNCKDARGLTPLHLLIKRNMEIIDYVGIDNRTAYGDLNIEYQKNEKIICMILETIESSGSMKNDSGLSSLHVACSLQNTSRAEHLCRDKKVNLNQQINNDSLLWPGYTALHFAAHFNPKIVKLLVKNGANFFLKNAAGLSAFDLCIQRYLMQNVHSYKKWIPSLRFDAEFSNAKKGWAYALSAITSDKKSFINYLLSLSNVDDDIRSSLWPSGFTLFHLAVFVATEVRHVNDLYAWRFYNPSEDTAERYEKYYKEQEIKYLLRIVYVCRRAKANIAVKDINNSTPLHLAFKLHKDPGVILIFKLYPGIVDCANNDNLSHLHIACVSGEEEAVTNLLTNGNALVNCSLLVSHNYYKLDLGGKPIERVIDVGSTPLHISVANRYVNIVKLLVDHGADVQVQDSNGLTPIHQVLIQQDMEEDDNDIETEFLQGIANTLLSSDGLRACETNYGLSHLHVASYANNVLAIEKILTDEAANINAVICDEKLKIFFGYTPLHVALKFQCKEAIATLIRRGADVLSLLASSQFDLLGRNSDFLAATVLDELICREQFQRFGITLLHSACAALDIERVTRLLAEGADSNVQVHTDSPLWPGYTPLHFVLTRRDNYPMNQILTIIRLLLGNGADVTLADTHNSTAPHIAMHLHLNEQPNFRFPLALIEAHNNFKVNPANHEGLSHFHIACYYNQMNKVEQFLKDGVDVNQVIDCASNNFLPGYTALHIAALFKHSDLVDMLLKHGADVRQKDADYFTPVHLAAYDTRQVIQSEESLLNFVKAGTGLHDETLWKETPLEVLLARKQPTSNTFRSLLKNENHLNLFNSYTEEGFIGLAISRNRNKHDFSRNSYFAALMNAPQANGPDHLGRTPIHNIVSVRQCSVPIEVYTEALDLLKKLDFDINAQNVTGQSPLHTAVKFSNAPGVTALLNLGANINTTDVNGKTPLSYISGWFDTTEIPSNNIVTARKKILELCLEQFYKMQDLALHVNSINISIESKLRKHYELSETTKGIWQAEKDKLETEKIDCSSERLHLSRFLSEKDAVVLYPRMQPSKRQNIDNFFRTHVFKLLQNFPHFGGLLLLQHRKAQERVGMIKVARRSISHLLSNYGLTDTCYDCILGHLTDNQLKTLLCSQM